MKKRSTDGEQRFRHAYMMFEAISDLVNLIANDKPPEVDYAKIDAEVVATVKGELQEMNNLINQQKELFE